ncbi:hypothetical protein HYC85_029471 [Camellia sinensis]|uniref:Uncharacterized protein n=1 Tax=Camellia sinensis TaxID=4442 RepID=A0A7J7FY24_CAMSI|nr:hypothetical protein HYC85_029471 [Camellia sinensis]
MHAFSFPLGNPPPCTSLPLFPLLCSSENCTTPKACSVDTVDHHRPSGNPTDHVRMVIDHLLSSRPLIIGRSALHVVDRPSLPAEPVLTAVEGKTRHGNVIQANVCTNTSLIMFVTQRCMFLDSRTTNRAFQCVMAQGTKSCILISNEMQCIETYKGAFNLYHGLIKR